MKITAEALDYIEDNWLEVDDDTLTTFVREALERPGDASFWDDDLYETHTLAFHTPAWKLTEDDIIGQANYRDALDLLEPYGAEAATISHWTYSTYECIKVPMLTEDGEITAGAVALWETVMGLQNYPLISDETYSELEVEVNDEAMTHAIYYYEQDNEVTLDDDQKQLIAEIYWEDYYGYHEPGYIEDERFQKVVDDVLSGDYQRHQETKLW